METSILLVAAVLFLGVVYVAVPVALQAYARYRGRKTVVCPQTGTPAHIEVAWANAMVAAALGRPRVDVVRCTHWPEREHCAQGCVKQLEEAPAAERVA